MKKTFVTTMPDRSGAFLQATRAMADLGLNITRVSYNKAVDSHTLFIEVEGSRDQLMSADHKLRDMGYLSNVAADSQVLLLEFKLPDIPGTVTKVLELIGSYDFNLSYLSSQEDGSGYQRFKMGLFVEDQAKFSRFLKEASAICSIRVLHYDQLERSFDNSIFYISFANELSSLMGLSEEDRGELVIQSNLVMQLLDEHGGSPAKTFEYIGKFGEALAHYKGEAFLPRITDHMIGEVSLTLIEPPCGSNTAILRYGNEYLFVDTGYACYRGEMLHLFHAIIPHFDTCKRLLSSPTPISTTVDFSPFLTRCISAEKAATPLPMSTTRAAASGRPSLSMPPISGSVSSSPPMLRLHRKHCRSLPAPWSLSGSRWSASATSPLGH